MNIEECIEKRYLLREKPSKDLVDKELAEADYDLSKAKKRFAEQDFNWANTHSEDSARHIVRIAEEFVKQMRLLL